MHAHFCNVRTDDNILCHAVAAPSQSAIISTPTSSSSHSMQKLSSAMNYGTSHVIKFTSSCSTVTFINTSPLLSNTLEASPGNITNYKYTVATRI